MSADLSLNARELYDSIMKGIEVELTMDQLPTLSEKYANESQKETEARGQRYYLALKEFEEVFSQQIDQSNKEAHLLNKFIAELLEEFSVKTLDAEALTSLEARIVQS